MVLWIDNFLFNGDEVVKARLKYLYKHVDKFYICEQRYTYQGKLKDTLFIEKYKDWFTDYIDKIVFIICDYDISAGTWPNEYNHRNYSQSFILKDYPTEKFICSVCDCDEIPSFEIDKENVYTATSEDTLKMEQDMYYYNLNWEVGGWTGPFFVNDIFMKKGITFQECRNRHIQSPGRFKCGWHLSYFMSPFDIKNKLESFSHSEYNTAEYKDIYFIKECTKNGNDLFKRGWNKLTNPVNKSFPKEIQEFGDYILSIQS